MGVPGVNSGAKRKPFPSWNDILEWAGADLGRTGGVKAESRKILAHSLSSIGLHRVDGDYE